MDRATLVPIIFIVIFQIHRAFNRFKKAVMIAVFEESGSGALFFYRGISGLNYKTYRLQQNLKMMGLVAIGNA